MDLDVGDDRVDCIGISMELSREAFGQVLRRVVGHIRETRYSKIE
jgi:hypothetical protein